VGEAEGLMRHALEWAPLDWELYVERAQMEGGHGQWTAALGDFRRARFLEPNYAGLPFQEGIYWLNIAPEFAIEAWRDALRRTPREKRPELYQNMLAHAYAGHPDLHASLSTLAATNYSMQLVYFGWATPEEFQARIAEVLHEDPGLRHFSPAELRRLFAIWMNKGDARELESLLVRKPQWLKVGYRALADYDASNGDVPGAVDLMERYLTPPRVPPAPAMMHEEAARRFDEDRGDLAAGMALYYEAMTAGRTGDALDILRRLSGESPKDCPAYVHYLEGHLLARAGKMEEAWRELAQCPDPE
jgi:tetratricopeptide (TPR) repeat protein